MARRLLTTEAVLEELELEDFDTDEPMMAGSDDEFDDIEDVYLEDVEDDDDDDNSAAPPHLPPRDTPSSSSDTLPCWSSTTTPLTIPPFTLAQSYWCG